MIHRYRTFALAAASAIALSLTGPATAQPWHPAFLDAEADALILVPQADPAARAVADAASSAQEAVRQRQFAPDPRALAAAVATSPTPLRIRTPGGEFREVDPSAYSSGVTIAVPANAQVRTTQPAPAFVDPYGYGVYDPGLPAYVTAPGYATVVEYETLIRAGRSPSYSITTLHPPRSHRAVVPHAHYHFHDHRHRGTYRPLGYDPLGGALHRDAQLRFHEASRPRLAPTPSTRQHFDHRPHRAEPPRQGIRIREATPMSATRPTASPAQPQRQQAAAPSQPQRPVRTSDSGAPPRSPK